MPYIRTKNFIHDSKDAVVVNENGKEYKLHGCTQVELINRGDY